MLWGLFLIIGLFFPGWARAEGEFTTNYNVDYRVEANGLTQARMNVELINKLSNIYASEFTLSIGSTSLTNIRLQTASGPVEPKITLGNKTTNITVIFPEKILGKDKAQQFTLEFTTSDFSRRLGNVWEISIPKLAKSESLSTYRLSLAVPDTFGQAATLTPAMGQVLGPAGINIGEFVKKFNEASKGMRGDLVPAEITVYEDRSYDFVLKTPPASSLILKALGKEKGSGKPNTAKIGVITKAQVKEIAEKKMADLNASDIDAAAKIIAGTARSIGVDVK